MQDLKWWQHIMPVLNCTKSIYLDMCFEPGALIDTDATLVQAGCVCAKAITFTPHSHSSLYNKPTSLPTLDCWPLSWLSRHGPTLLVTLSLWHTLIIWWQFWPLTLTTPRTHLSMWALWKELSFLPCIILKSEHITSQGSLTPSQTF